MVGENCIFTQVIVCAQVEVFEQAGKTSFIYHQ